MFDFVTRLDELRSHSTEQVRALRDRAVAEQRRWRTEELAATRILDERRAFDDSLAARGGISVRDVRETVECARALESLPEVAAAAHDGRLSEAQLQSVTQLADAGSDADWARRAPNIAPTDLARLVRTARKPAIEDARAAREARSFRVWQNEDIGMWDGRFRADPLDGAYIHATFTHMIDKMRPAKNEPWASRDHRMFDALMELCHRYADAEAAAGRS